VGKMGAGGSIPVGSSPELYQYQAVPMKLNATFHAIFCSQQWALQMDWQGVMNHHLGSGWRLIEVFEGAWYSIIVPS
jgi:hypothetical protein